jgi:hypothetical protein
LFSPAGTVILPDVMNIATFIVLGLLGAVIASAIRSIPVLFRDLFDLNEEEDSADR